MIKFYSKSARIIALIGLLFFIPLWVSGIPTFSKPTVSTTSVSIFDATSATMGGEVTADGGATVTERGVVYSTITNPTTADTKVQIGDGIGSFSQSVSSLTANTTYYVKAYAINTAGTSYGNEVTVATSAAASSTSSDGIMDCSFGDLGKAIVQPEGKAGRGQIVAVYTGGVHAGKLVVAGYVENTDADLICIRYNVDGTLDNTFGTGGVSVTVDVGTGSEVVRDVVVQDDGTVIALVSTNNNGALGLVKFTASGNLDTSFDSDGKMITLTGAWQGLTLDGSGNVYVCGRRTISSNMICHIVKYNSVGAYQATYQADFEVGNSNFEYFETVWASNDGNTIYGAGYAGTGGNYFAVAKFTSGVLDNTFSGDGKYVINALGTSNAYGIVVQSDGKVVLGGDAGGKFVAARFTTSGVLDASFDTDGIAEFNVANTSATAGISIQPDDKVIVGGVTYGNFSAVRFNTDGSLDTSFGKDGLAQANFGEEYVSSGDMSEVYDNKVSFGGYTGSSPESFAPVRF